MKGRFRRGKKAFRKSGPLSGRQWRMSERYSLFLEKRRIRTISAARGAQVALVTGMATAQALCIIQTPGVPIVTQCLKLLEVATDMANAIKKIHQPA